MNPLISVIMPAYNAGDFIYPSIKSILGQTYGDLELIIVDDGSTDNTADIIRSFNDKRIVMLKNYNNLGLPRSLNIAIDACRGKYIARSDADDLNMSMRLQVQIDFLESHPDVDVVGSDYYVFNFESKIIGGFRLPASEHGLLIRNIYWLTPLAHATIMARSEWLKKYKYRPEYPRAEDYELFLRSYSHSRFANLPAFLYAVRDPGAIKTKKLLLSNRDNLIMRFLHWREYNMPAYCVIGYPFLILTRLFFYSMARLHGKSFFWGRLNQLEYNTSFLNDQMWIKKCHEQ